MSTGTFNAQQQSDVHAYWEFNRGTNWVFPHYELPFTGGLPGTFPGLQYGLQSVIPGSGPFGVVNTAATHGDDPNNPRDPDRFEPASSGQTETRNRFDPSGLTAEIFRNVFTRPASFLPGVTDVGERLLRAYAIEVARVDQNGDGALSFAEANVALYAPRFRKMPTFAEPLVLSGRVPHLSPISFPATPGTPSRGFLPDAPILGDISRIRIRGGAMWPASCPRLTGHFMRQLKHFHAGYCRNPTKATLGRVEARPLSRIEVNRVLGSHTLSFRGEADRVEVSERLVQDARSRNLSLPPGRLSR